MGRILAIDYGTKRTGIAASDPAGIIATGLQTVRTHDLLQFLQEYAAKETIDLFVVGHPKQMDNTDSENMRHITAKKKTRQDKALIDTMSATLILSSYMEQQRNLAPRQGGTPNELSNL